MTKASIVFVRHGESQWNDLNLFCGWYDANLSPKGIEEAINGGKALKNAGYTHFDMAFTSLLTRAQITMGHMLDGAYEGREHEKKNVLMNESWRLNERHYGGLTGQDKKEAVEKFGAEQVQIWRRSFDTPPPPMDSDHKHYNDIRNHPKLQAAFQSNLITEEEYPKSESLELTIKRTLPYWNNTIVPALKSGKKCIVAAHGNSLRGIVCHLDKMNNSTIMELNLPTGIPFVYDLEINDDGSCKVLKKMQFLGDEKTVKEAMEKVANQTGGAAKKPAEGKKEEHHGGEGKGEHEKQAPHVESHGHKHGHGHANNNHS